MMSSQGRRSTSKSPPRRGASSRAKSGAKSAGSKITSAGSKHGSDSARSKSPSKSRLSSSKSEGMTSTGGKASSITGRRAKGRTTDFEKQGLKTVDMSGQGMTTVGGSVFARKDVGELDLSSNNLRVIPPEIRKLTTIVHIDLSRNGIRCGHSQDFGGIPKDLASLPNLEVMIISECNLPFIPPAIWMCQNLKVLDISRNKINMLVPDIGNLEKLQHLNAQQTSIMTLPPEIALCQDLEEIMLWGNVIESLPETLKELPKLKVLAINYRSFCSTVDSYREGLLMKGQIQSEHIPPVLFEMPALDGLDLNETKLNNLPEHCIGKLKEFFVADNFFTKMPQMVVRMESLLVLDISGNMIKQIPEEIGNLVNLTTIKMDNNKVSVFPTSFGRLSKLTSLIMGGNKFYSIPEEIGNLTGLKTLVLDRNNITNIPESIIKLEELETLDLTDNKIQALPINFYQMKKLKSAHAYQKFHKYGLWLHKNPLVTPPQEIWKTDNPEQIFRYLRRLQIQQTKNLQRQKLYVMGSSQAGKTSLVYAMMTQKSFLTEGMSASTSLLDFFPWKTDNGVHFMVHDLGGAKVYKDVHHLFLDPKGIYFIVYDHSAFTKEKYHEVIGCWLETIRLYVPGAVVRIIGTQVDKCYPEVKDSITSPSELKADAAEWDKKLDITVSALDTAMKDTQLSRQECDHIKLQKFRTIALKNKALRMMPNSLVSSAEGIEGILGLVNDLELAAVDKTLSPHAQVNIPETWFEFRSAMKARKEVCISLSEIRAMAKAKKFPKNEITDCLTFLAQSGEIIWFPKNPELKNVVFQRPQKLVDILKGLFRHDQEHFLDFESNRIFTCKGQMSRDEFDKAKYMLESCGQISRTLLECLWFYLNISFEGFSELLDLTPRLNLCYAVPRPEAPPSRSEFVPIMVIPAFNKDLLPLEKDLQEHWPYPLQPGQCELKISTSFLLNYPSGLFEKLACQIQDQATFRVDWKDVVFAEMETGAILIQKKGDTGSGDCVIDVKTRGVDAKNTKLIMSEVWRRLDTILSSYAGLVWHSSFSHENCPEKEIEQNFLSQIFNAVSS